MGNVLLPGMYCMPIYAVPKPDSVDLRLVNNYSAGPFSLNSMVEHSKVTGYPLDNLHQLGQMLLNLRRDSLGLDLGMWKSDISEAYWELLYRPCMLLWKQRVLCNLRVSQQPRSVDCKTPPWS